MIACERCLTTEESEVLAPQKRCFGSKNIATNTYVVTQQSSLVLETFSFLEVASLQTESKSLPIRGRDEHHVYTVTDRSRGSMVFN
ncbi:electron transfer flavoprotein regulatory factor 1 isoform X2 [Gopherus evgoodei]|uniref:electron transfer flavoprotein regulatory factor 1 isoform X2 n=1 Tax=Gopherus evgoodei TaxID=1825980 RepID=UPI0011CFA826|nr:electron transfer flavoprotein regulatory factor 1 isoform X2 [Gopherus evgoodei]